MFAQVWKYHVIFTRLNLCYPRELQTEYTDIFFAYLDCDVKRSALHSVHPRSDGKKRSDDASLR